MIRDKDTLQRKVRAAVRRMPAVDLCTRLPVAPMGDPRAHGLTALLTCPALRAQADAAGVDCTQARDALAEAAFQALFIDRSPVSEAAADALTALERLDFPVARRDWTLLREEQAARRPEHFFQEILDAAELRGVGCVADPFAPDAQRVWQAFAEGTVPEATIPILSLTTLQRAVAQDVPLDAPGYALDEARYGLPLAELARLADNWAAHTRAQLVCVDVPETPLAQDALLRYVAFPLCRARGLPLLIRLGRETAGAQLAWLAQAFAQDEALCAAVVASAPESVRALISACADPWGHALFPVLAADAALAGDALGTLGIRGQLYASQATVAEQLPGRWARARRALAQVLYTRYLPLIKAGWGIQSAEIEDDAAKLLGGNWEAFCRVRAREIVGGQ